MNRAHACIDETDTLYICFINQPILTNGFMEFLISSMMLKTIYMHAHIRLCGVMCLLLQRKSSINLHGDLL